MFGNNKPEAVAERKPLFKPVGSLFAPLVEKKPEVPSPPVEEVQEVKPVQSITLAFIPFGQTNVAPSLFGATTLFGKTAETGIKPDQIVTN